MKVNYVFTYKAFGNTMKFITPIVMDENVDANLMEKIFYTLVENSKEFKDMGVTPKDVKLLMAFCPSSTRFPKFEYPTSTSKVSSSIFAAGTGMTDCSTTFLDTVKPETENKEQYYTFVYEGKFMKATKDPSEPNDMYNIIISFIRRKPLVLNEWLVNHFKEEFERQTKRFGWELVGITLINANPTGCYSDPSVFHPEESYEMYWVRVQDESRNDGGETWIPGFYQNGKMWSAIGELTSPESPEDTRPFKDSPFEDYIVVRKPEN